MKHILKLFLLVVKKLYISSLILVIVLQTTISISTWWELVGDRPFTEFTLLFYFPYIIASIPYTSYLLWLFFTEKFNALPEKTKHYHFFVSLAPWIALVLNIFITNIVWYI